MNTISSLESQQRKSGQSSGSPDLQALLEKMAESSAIQSQEVSPVIYMCKESQVLIFLQIERLTSESDVVRQELEKAQAEHERDKEELQDLRDRIKEVELAGLGGLNRTTSTTSVSGVQTLDAELDSAITPPGDTKAKYVPNSWIRLFS